jgi:zinc protease
LAQEPVTGRELEKALKRAKAQFVMAGESVTGQAQMLGLAEMVAGDHCWYEKTLESLNNVTLEDIDRVRDKYLRKGNRIVGRYYPTGNETFV